MVKQTALKDLKQIQKSGDKATTIKRVEKKLKFLITLKSISLDATGCIRGLYFVRVECGGEVYSRKLIVN